MFAMPPFSNAAQPLARKVRRRVQRLASLSGLAAVVMVAIPAVVAHAQDVYEIQVYEYETVPAGWWALETHFNYTARGSTALGGPQYPSQGQVHLTFELTRGLTDYVELAGYIVTARREGAGPEIVGYRIRPRARVPKSWNWPVDAGLSLEVGFPDTRFEEHPMTLEVRPVLEKKFGRLQVDLNPVIGKALKGPGVNAGWDFEPNARLGWQLTPTFDLSLEYYGSTGNVTNWLPGERQVHQFYPGFDWQLTEGTVINFGVGLPVTNAGDGMIVKMRLGVTFGGK